jgi:hypothetical protein
MSAEKQEHEELTALRQRLEALKIVVSKIEHGGFNVASYSEPLFCFDRPDLESVAAVVEDTLRSYLKTFYHVDKITVSTENITVEAHKIPVQRVEPKFNVKPSFGGDFTRGRELAIA